MRIAWIGTGVMGAPMAGHLMNAGHELTVFTRTRSRADGLVADGARWADTPADAASGAEVVFTMLGYPHDVRDTILGSGALLEEMADGALLIDHTTSDPTLAAEIAQTAAQRGVDALDAPVSGGDIGAQNGQLMVMVGGSAAAFGRAKPLLDVYGRAVVHHGDPGAGQHTKMANQIAIASTMVAMCEALIYAEAAGLDPAQVCETISGGAAGSWSLTNLAPRALAGDNEPGFKIDHFLKDLGIALEESRRMRIDLPGLELARGFYEQARDKGYGEKGTQALLASLRDR